ncbi:MAG: amino acid adenylation domain-containing protein [Candidatus Aminicenantes bacterium]|nr:amino acid adenylation domain-containing protein [Candidatus Aminicenantes bacterium]NIM78330.1 amino acid adenylation domain-containing protein [Candidatus Aminicenantes bacterium]NIN17564.1 amino acid adenylation domain-containing protein [Candidatus Aminicenantes bacterium]NIN41447.1 amino acid adenylation domain-containing protein [Candidatus Aminicenantes bacterium]NIN84216.1 amino acid adenylation domain-containing protein [Candidatus Aminicenantes bacterium]
MTKESRTGLEIAVIGMTGRFPGAKNLDQFWNNLINGIESIPFYSEEELIETGVDPDILQNPDYVKSGGGVLEGKEYFDASFFDYSPSETMLMDPQIRIFHECAWEALEDAGYAPSTYKGYIGLYAGSDSSLHWESIAHLSKTGDQFGAFVTTQLSDKDYLATRVSYKLDLKGPALVVRTACSTALAAIHLACRTLLTGDCHMALAGGVSVNPSPKTGYLYQEGMVFSPDGHCRAFDAQSKGTIPGNGVGVIVLKPLQKAVADGDHIYAVVKGTAINNDGIRKMGFSAPSVQGQTEVIRAAQRFARIPPESITYIETHGTGTILGDAIEIQALKKAFNSGQKGVCAIGSVKTNVGHLGAAAGIVGFIKTVLALKNKCIPPSLHFKSPNPEMDLENSPFFVNTKVTPWKSNGYPLRAGVSSFGIGGTNAHIVLEEWPELRGSDGQTAESPQLILLSARTQSALDRMTENLVNYLKQNPGIKLADAAYTLQVGRQAFIHRKIAVCSTINEAVEVLTAQGERGKKAQQFTIKENKRPVIFMFSGQGTQYVDMGLDLYRRYSEFQQEIDRCSEILKPLTGYDLRAILYPEVMARAAGSANPPGEWIYRQDVTQPLMFVFEYSLARLLMKWGIKADAMIGYSIGEYVAACLADVLGLEDALKLVAIRGKLMHEIPRGLMLNIPLPEEELKPLLDEELSLAAANGPSCIVSGPEAAVERLEKKLKEKKYICMRLSISHAGHSRMMAPMLPKFKKEVEKVRLNPPKIPFISSVTAGWIHDREAVDPHYWSEHLQKTVRFTEGLKELVKKPRSIFIEIGPGRDLKSMLGRYIDKKSHQKVLNLLRPPQKSHTDMYFLLNAVGHLWLYGVPINWQAIHAAEKRHRLALPTYPFTGRRFWFTGNPFRLRKETLAAQSISAAPGKNDITEIIEPEILESTRIEADTTPLEQRPELYTEYIPPVNETEHILANLWQEFFGIRPIGIDDDFFDLGGDSLKATVVIARTQNKLGVSIPIAEFFKRPTVKSLALFLSGRERRDIYSSLEAGEEKEYYPLSAAQKRLFIIQQINEDKTGYNEMHLVRLEGKPDKNRMKEVFLQLVQRHESLRTSFHVVAEEAVQRVHEKVDFEIEYNNLLAEVTGDIEDRREAIIHHYLLQPFDLSQAPLLRVVLIKENQYSHVLAVFMHHIITDGTSLTLLANEFMALYTGQELPPLRIRYKDYSQWQYTPGVKENLKQQEEYWLRQFEGEIPILNLCTDFPRPSVQSFEGGAVEFHLNREQTKALHELSQTEGTTLFMVFMALYNILLSKLSTQEDITVGTPTAGRNHIHLERVIGVFINTLALRSRPTGEKSFRDFLREVKERALKAFGNQNYPFEELVVKVDVGRDVSRNPLFDVMFLFQNFLEIAGVNSDQVMAGSGLTLKNYAVENKIAKFDLALFTIEIEDQLQFILEYCTKLFRKETIVKFIKYFKNVISAALRDPGQKISTIEIITGEEKQQLVYDFNATAVEYPSDNPFHQLFARQVKRTPDHVALIGQMHLSYKELNEKSGQLAYLLKEKGVQPNTIVGIMTERSVEMIVGILGILKAGGAYLPIDPGFPQERIDYMLKDSRARVLLSEVSEVSKVSGGIDVVKINELSEQLPTHLCYIIYTSGSTGKPKGVMLRHQSLVNFIKGITDIIDFTGIDSVLSLTTISFDIFGLETLLPLVKGSRVVIGVEEEQLNAEAAARAMSEKAVTILQLTPSRLSLFLPNDKFTAALGSLKYLLVGGEALPEQLLEKTREFVTGKIYNMYGPTETCIWSTVKDVSKGNPLNIGKPIANTQIYILGQAGTLQPIGITGELCIGGDGVARGYLNRPELTAEKFFVYYRTNRTYIPSKKIYRTGDLAQWLPDGNIEFLGRIDHQVKIRGFRIELAEIESQLKTFEKIKEAVVVMREDKNKGKYLCAYITAQSAESKVQSQGDIEERNQGLSSRELREFLARTMPDYMIPSYFVMIDRIPLTPNGKINRKALPEPEAGITPDKYIGPRDEVEEKLVEIWQEILGIEKDKIGIETSFFVLGGNSMNLIRMIPQIYQTFGIELPFTRVLANPIIREIAEHLKSAKAVEESVTLLNPPAQKKLFGLPPAIAFGIVYQDLASLISGYAFYSFNFIEEEDRLNRYVEIITNLQPVGPYILLGYSAGGLLSFDITYALESSGFEVSDLILLDSFFTEKETRALTEADREEWFNGIEKNLERVGAGALKEKIFAKTHRYITYYENITHLERVNANVHLILSEESQNSEINNPGCWDELTTKKSVVYPGFGGHNDMLSPGSLEKNAGIIREILGTITTKIYKDTRR